MLDGNGASFDGIVMMEANSDIEADVLAEVSAQFTGLAAAYSESSGGSAYADPTFAIDDPAFADSRIRPRACPRFCLIIGIALFNKAR